MVKFFLKLLKYLLKFIDDLPVIGAARKFAEKNLEITLIIVFIIFLINSLYIFKKQKKK